jgi:hypothetical protein
VTGSGGAKAEDKMTLEVGYMPKGHLVAGYIAYIKVIDENGDYYWASRQEGLNNMEQLGMACDMVNEIQEDLKSSRRNPGDE